MMRFIVHDAGVKAIPSDAPTPDHDNHVECYVMQDGVAVECVTEEDEVADERD